MRRATMLTSVDYEKRGDKTVMAYLKIVWNSLKYRKLCHNGQSDEYSMQGKGFQDS
jgi:hypothetical protein